MEPPAILPARFTSTPWTSPQAGGHSVHVAQGGETLESIAHQYGAPVEAVHAVNPQIRGGNVASGEPINLPSGFGTPMHGGSTTFPIDSGSQMHGGSTNLPVGSGPQAYGGSTGLPIDAGAPVHGGSIDLHLPLDFSAPMHGTPVNLPIDSGTPVHAPPFEPPQTINIGMQQASPPETLPADTNPHGIDPPRSDALPRDTLPPAGNPPPRGGDQPAATPASKPDAAPATPLAANAPSDPRGSTVRTDSSGLYPATDKTAPTTVNGRPVTTGGEASVAARAQTAAAMLAAPLLTSTQSNGVARGDVAVPMRPFENVPVTVPTAKDVPQNAPGERRELPRTPESETRTLQQATNYDSARLLRDVQARIISDPRTPADVPARTPADANAKSADKASTNATTPAQAALEESGKRIAQPGDERDPRLALRRAGDSSWLLDWARQLAQIRRTYFRSRIDETPDLLTTAAVIGTGVVLLAGMFALYALYKYWAPH